MFIPNAQEAALPRKLSGFVHFIYKHMTFRIMFRPKIQRSFPMYPAQDVELRSLHRFIYVRNNACVRLSERALVLQRYITVVAHLSPGSADGPWASGQQDTASQCDRGRRCESLAKVLPMLIRSLFRIRLTGSRLFQRGKEAAEAGWRLRSTAEEFTAAATTLGEGRCVRKYTPYDLRSALQVSPSPHRCQYIAPPPRSSPLPPP